MRMLVYTGAFFDQLYKRRARHHARATTFISSTKEEAGYLHSLNGPWRNVIDTLFIIVGSFLIAVAFNLFLLPNQIASGGVSGLSILGHEWFGWEPKIYAMGD